MQLLIVNYNLPEVVDTLTALVPGDWIIVDNGSDIVPPHPATTIHVKDNGGWMSGLSAGLDAVTDEFVWVFTTSMAFVHCDTDPIAELMEVFKEPEAVCVTPGWVGHLDAGTHKWFALGAGRYNKIGFATPAECWRTEFLRDNLERRLKHGWGTDYDLTYKVRQAGYSAWRANGVRIEIAEHNGYAEGRRKQTLDESRREAYEVMASVLSEKYGPSWREVLGVI